MRRAPVRRAYASSGNSYVARTRTTNAMRIKDSRHQTLDDYSIETVQVLTDACRGEHPFVYPYLNVSLKAKPYSRDRFSQGGTSYETKKHGARAIMLGFDELQMLTDAVREEMGLCYDVLNKHGLLRELAQTRDKRQEKSRQPA